MKNYKKTASYILNTRISKKGKNKIVTGISLSERGRKRKPEEIKPESSRAFICANKGILKIYSGYLSVSKDKPVKEDFVRKINNFWVLG